MQRLKHRIILTMVVCLSCAGVLAQAPQATDCGLKPPIFESTSPNIFSAEQEQYLGEALAEYQESDLKIVPPQPDDQLTQIGERLVATLPASGLHYRFRVYDSGEINGFSLAGGRVYISRKLIAAVKNDDELAGVLAHELGHISTHQTAIELTRAFRIRLGVTKVTDRADIFARVHQFLSTPSKPGEEEDKEQKDQLAADHVGLYAMVRAGYAPGSFSSFLNESMLNKGKTGNALTDFFGLTHESSQRYRSALKLISELPVTCREKQPQASNLFLAWQRNLVEERTKTVAEGLSGDRPIKLTSPLRPSLWRIRFSQDGRYILAQDEESITVADKAAGKVLFQIDAPDANQAEFTPDSKSVVFNDPKLRVERWDIASGKRTGVKEMVVYDGCNQSLLAMDGNTLVCVNTNEHQGAPRISLRIIDVDSGQVLLDKPGFYEMSTVSAQYISFILEMDILLGGDLVKLVSSPDGRYLFAIANTGHSLAYDFEHRQTVELGGRFKELVKRPMCFLGPDQLFVTGEFKGKGLYSAQILSFPDGRVVKESVIGGQQLDSVTKGHLLVARPINNYALGILDPEQSKYILASKFDAVDVWDNAAAAEDTVGGLAVGQIGVSGAAHIPLPLGPLPRPQAGFFSSDGKYLAVSLRHRSEVWDLETGKQVALLRPFRSVWMDDDDHIFGNFPKYMDKEPTEGEITLTPLAFKDLAKPEDNDWQYRDLQFHYKPMGKDKSHSHHTTLEVKKMGSETLAWSHDFAHEAPACWPAEDDRLVLGWDLSNDAAKAEIKSHLNLQKEAEALKNQKKGLLVETVVPETGAMLQEVVIPEADLTRGTDDERRARVSGEYVLVHGEHGNTVIYRIENGEKVGEFFGSVLATDAGSKVIAAVNREEEMLLVDERNGKELQRFTLDSPIRLAQIVINKKKELMVLTADQVVHRLPLPQ